MLIERFLDKIICGDALEVLKRIPSNSIDTIVTSPPYWGLRDYGDDSCKVWGGDPNCEHEFEFEHIQREASKTGIISEKAKIGQGYRNYKSGFCKKCGAWYGQLGLEPDFDMYIDHILAITKELKRVLKPTGIFFFNVGDTYYGGGHVGLSYKKVNGKLLKDPKYGEGRNFCPEKDWDFSRYNPKCLCMTPYRIAMRMIDEQGWILRNIIIWHKPNHMPSSVKDRFTNAYEPIFMFVKNVKDVFYWHEKTGIAVDKKPSELKEGIDWDWIECSLCEGSGEFEGEVCERCKGKGKYKQSYWHSVDYYFDLDAVREPHQSPLHAPGNKKGREIDVLEYNPFIRNIPGQLKDPSRIWGSPLGKNPGDLWSIPTEPFPEAHFAVYPTKLIEKILKAGCPRQVCRKCGKPRVRIVKIERPPDYDPSCVAEYADKVHSNWHNRPVSKIFQDTLRSKRETIGWTDCGCNAGFDSGIVLDPFAGSGTTCYVAKKMGYHFIGIEIVPKYCEMARKRVNQLSQNIMKYL